MAATLSTVHIVKNAFQYTQLPFMISTKLQVKYLHSLAAAKSPYRVFAEKDFSDDT